MNIYLCSRVALDAHRDNTFVADTLRNQGYPVFVPHEQYYNEILAHKEHTITDYHIFRKDMTAMCLADLCVAVGRLGVDCAFEVGWFIAKGIPVYWYIPQGCEVGHHPMLYQAYKITTLQEGILPAAGKIPLLVVRAVGYK